MLLEKFRQKYHAASICTQLDRVHEGKFIVKAEISIASDSFFTAFGSGSAVEDAEDKAVDRVLQRFFTGRSDNEQFGFDVVGIAEETIVDPPFPEELMSAIAESQSSIANIQSIGDHHAVSNQAIAEQSPPVEPEKPAKKRKTKPVEEVLPVEQPEPVATQPVEESASNCDDGFCEINQVSFPPVDEPVIEAPKPIEPEPEAPILTLETQVVEAPKLELTEPLDFGAVMATMNEHLKRLGWTNEQGKAYLLETYGKRSRQLLSDEELLEFLAYLESQPDPANV